MTTPRDVVCQELVELITDYLEGALPADEVAAVEAHLEACSHCERYLRQMRTTIAAIGRVPVDTLSEEAMDALLAAFTRER